MRKRNPIAKAVKHIRPQVIPDKREKLLSKIKIDNDPIVIEDKRTDGEVISDIRDLLIEVDIRLNIIHEELDLLRARCSIQNQA